MLKINAENKKYKTVSITIYGKKHKVHIKKKLGLEAWVGAIDSIIDFVFINNTGSINDYAPSFLEFARRITIIDSFTDLKISQLEPNADKLWEIAINSGLYEKILKYAKPDVDKILEAADRGINARVSYLQNKTDINALISRFADSTDEFGKNFTTKDATDILALLKKFGNMDTDSIVSAIMKNEKEKK